MTATEAIKQVLDLARSEVGYHEKASNTDYATEWATPSSSGKVDLLWTNPNPSSATFAAQTVAIDLSDYYGVYIVFEPAASYGNYTVCIALKGIGGVLFGSNGGRLRIRQISAVTDTGVTFAAGVGISSYGSTETNNAVCFPLYIYGIKA